MEEWFFHNLKLTFNKRIYMQSITIKMIKNRVDQINRLMGVSIEMHKPFNINNKHILTPQGDPGGREPPRVSPGGSGGAGAPPAIN